MVKKSNRRSKHIPRRTCVGCREVLPKRSLIRIVNGPNGVEVDPTGKAHGRGAYLHNKHSCWMQAIKKGALDHTLKTTLTDQEKHDLLTYMENHIPDESTDQKGAEDLSA